MSLRRAAVLAVPLALAACTKVTQQPQTPDLVFATFNSTTGAIPIPNDLVLQLYSAPTAQPSATVPAAQIEVLKGYARSGGFPSDVEVAITIPLNALTWDASAGTGGQYVPAAQPPTLDAASVTAQTVTLLKVDGGAVTPVPYQAVISPGLLTLRKPAAADGTRHWAGGRYVVAVRGGAGGVKTTTGLPIHADTGVALAVQNVDLTNKENQPPGGLTPALAAQVNGLRTVLWSPLDWKADASGVWSPLPTATVTPAFTAVDSVFPHLETAVIATFGVDRSAHVALDASAGQAPFPSDFLLDFNVAHCPTGVAPCVANNPAFGAAAAGLTTLDGFSTTGLLLLPLTGAVDASTVTRNSVHLFEVPASGTPVWLKDLASTLPAGAGAAYATQPPQFNQTVGGRSLTTTVALAPAQLADLGPLGKFALPPLKEHTRYVVLVTRRVLNADGTPLTRGAAANIVLSTTQPLYGPGPGGATVPYIQGADLATAEGLQTLRDGLAPLLDALPYLTGGATSKDDVVMAYTVTTQSVTGTSLKLAAAPYSIEATAGAAIFAGTGLVPLTPPAGVPTAGVQGFYSLAFNSADLIDKSTGALRPTLAADLASPATLPTLLTTLHAVVAVPDPAAVPPCPGPPYPAGARCAKLVVVGHGLNGSSSTVFALASALASQGFLVAGIDYPLHGERNWCAADADCTTDGTANGTCDKAGAFAASAGQGDPVRPGVCDNGSVPRPAGSRYFVSANFFRTRDTFRQNVFDVSALTLAAARPPTMPAPAGNPLTSLLTPLGVVVDPSAIYYEGISLGSLDGTSVVATNPRISRASLSVGGGPIVDVFTTSPSFQAGVDALFPALLPGFTRAKVTPGDPAFDPVMAAKYLQLLQVAKWILDPGDPINYAGHLRGAPMPNLLASPDGSVAQDPKDVFAQIAYQDTVVPNPTNDLLDMLIGGATTLYTDAVGGPAPHAMLALSPQVQLDAALYLVDPANVPPATRAVAFP